MAARLLALALAVLIGPLPAHAQGVETNGRRDQALVSMDYQDMELKDVIKAVAKFTGKNFLYDDRVRGTVTVISETPVTIDEAYRVFESILQVKGFTTVEGPGGITKILPIREAKEAPIATVTGRGREPNRDLYITRLVPLKYVKADTIANTFRPLVSKDANVIAYAPTNTMIVTDTAANIRRIMTILSEIDVRTYQDQIKMIPIEYADAAQVAEYLQEIFSESQTQTQTARRRPTRARAQRASTQAQADAASTFGAAGEPRFITDERTNSIIVIAPEGTIRQVERLVKLLDYKRRGTGRIHVYRLQNADSEEMAQTLSSLTGGGGARPTAVPGRAAGAAAAAGQAAAVAELEGGIRITADAPTNSLIIQASAEGFAAIRDVIEELDTRRPQVMVEALIMEADVDNDQTLGAGWLARTSFGTDDTAGEFGSNTTGTAQPNLLGPAPSPITDPGDFLARVVGKTVTLLVPDPANPGAFIEQEFPVIQGFIQAAASDSDTNIIASPTLLTADNEEAQIIIGQNIPVPTSRLQQSTGQADEFVTSQNIERQDVGVTLRVTPQISEGDSVRLEIFQEISNVIAFDPELGPTTTNREVENTVFVKDGEAVMIGGILQDTQTLTVNKVPFLGDIPFLGWAFKTEVEDVAKINLMVVLTPRIVRDPEDLQRLTIEQRERFRASAHEQMQFDEDELEKRRKAEEAGIPLPLDPNPVRRELERHTENYPTESFPVLEQRQEQREKQRLDEIEELSTLAGGSFRVQVAVFRISAEAAKLLEELIRQGYDGTVYSIEEGGQTLHLVQLGPYVTEERAQQVAREVRADSGRTAMVIVEP